MGDLLGLFSSGTKMPSKDPKITSKIDFNKKMSIQHLRSRGVNGIKFNGQALDSKEIRNVVGNIAVGRSAKQIMRQLKDKYQVGQDDRKKIMRAVSERYSAGVGNNRIGTAEELSKVNKILKKQDISSPTKQEIMDKIKRELKTTGKSGINSGNIEMYVKRMKANIGYLRYVDSQHETPLPSAAFGMKQKRSGKEGALKGSLETGDRKIYSEDIGVEQAGKESVVSANVISLEDAKKKKSQEGQPDKNKPIAVAGEHGVEQENFKMAI